MSVFLLTPRLLRLPVLIFSLIISFSLIAGQKPHAPASIQNVSIVSAESVIELILNNPEMIVIDSRKKNEYMKGHIEGAVNILNTELTEQGLKRISPDKSTTILFYCNGTRCLRSSDSINKAKSWGYKQLIWFRGGWKEWTEKRLPIITE